MSNAYGIKALMPVDAPHVLGFGSARTGSTDLLLDIWNGSTSGARVFSIQKDGRVQVQDGSVSAPILTWAGDLDTGFYRIGANNLGLALGGSKVVDFGASTVAVTGALTTTGAITGGAGLALSGAVTGVTNLAASGNITGATWQGSVIGAAYGGTGWSSYVAGDILYASGTTALAQLGIGAANAVLTSSGSAPQWSTSLALAGGLTTGADVTVNGNLTVTGTLNASIGSLSASSVTAGTFGAGDYTFPANLTVTSNITATGGIRMPTATSAIRPTTGVGGLSFRQITVPSGAGASQTGNINGGGGLIVFGGGRVWIAGLGAGTTINQLGQTPNSIWTGSPAASEVGVNKLNATTLAITHGSSVTAQTTYTILELLTGI